MRERLILLAGWGLGTAPLQPLVAALQGLDPHLQIQLELLPELASSAPADWLDELDARLPQDCWLGGWSLGGMLAAELAARRGERCRGLLTLASNPRFVASTEWPAAMPAETFELFRSGCAEDAQATLKRFALLCTQGSAEPRALGRLLFGGAPNTGAEQLLAGLDVLAALDTRAALQAFNGPQLHLFAAADALVPAAAAGELQSLLGDVETGLLGACSHAFPVERPHEVAAAIQAFLHEVGDD
ncbi:alpha/beta fold hydrolase [Aquipseudomonas ullengensis]|uniref:Alpha/beta fold hydrolase n=1 Tax=Aquipseudomonas ullengensis TaxID=2759166 RepID=A0A7W4LIT1_9GAMM|nr:alpha/beta fold hydrolase [Pseudomonas ullengensis]MBB2493843.1 alpha/beta fold hydrolase [Pseudomonas ullengensis]